MNIQTHSKKDHSSKHIKAKPLILACIASFSLCGCAKDQNKDKTLHNNPVIEVSAASNRALDKQVGVPVLLFHKFLESPKDIKNPETEITLDYFEKTLDYLKANGYTTISFQQLYSYVKDGVTIPRNSIVLSIDDGFYVDDAVKLLKQYNMHADLAIVGERDEKGYFNDPKDYYSWEQIANLAQDKDGNIIDVIDHTPQHIDLEELSEKPNNLKNLFKSSMDMFKQELGSSSDILVYPYGTYNEKIEEIAAQAGYKMGITADEGLNYYGDNPFEIKRYIVNENVSVEQMFERIKSHSLNRDDHDKNNDSDVPDDLTLDKKMGVPVLLFHKFLESPKDIKYPETEITLDYFKSVLDYLKSNGYSTISLQQLYSYIKNGAPIPKNSIVLSIDDGFCTDSAIKLLKQYNMHADLAIVGQRDEKGYFTDPQSYYSWEQVTNLALDKDGDIIDITDHTPQHTDLAELSKKPDELKQLLNTSMSIFKQRLGSSSDILVYPYGSYNQQVEEIAAQAGYKMGITTDEGLNFYEDNPFEIKRYLVSESVSIEELFNKINSNKSK